MSMLRALVLRAQRWSIIRPALRRRMLNAIGARIAADATIEHSCWLTSPKIEMESGSLLNAFAFVDGSDWLVIEDGARVAVRTTIITRPTDRDGLYVGGGAARRIRELAA